MPLDFADIRVMSLDRLLSSLHSSQVSTLRVCPTAWPQPCHRSKEIRVVRHLLTPCPLLGAVGTPAHNSFPYLADSCSPFTYLVSLSSLQKASLPRTLSSPSLCPPTWGMASLLVWVPCKPPTQCAFCTVFNSQPLAGHLKHSTYVGYGDTC